MKKLLLPIIVVLLLALVLAYLFREPLRETAYSWITRDMFISADEDNFNPGPVIGSHFPGLRASFRGRDIQLLDDFAGENGTVFVASRSLDWCPFCMHQMIELQAHKSSFDSAGIGLVAMTYDAPALQQRFIDKHGITIPVLSDRDALSFKTLGILNTQYSDSDPQFGIPHPGMIIIDTSGTVVAKLFVEDYSRRVSATAALVYARTALQLD